MCVHITHTGNTVVFSWLVKVYDQTISQATTYSAIHQIAFQKVPVGYNQVELVLSMIVQIFKHLSKGVPMSQISNHASNF